MNKKKLKILKRTQKRTAKKLTRRKHDPFFRYIYAIPENTRTLLRLAEHRNSELRRMLSSVDMQSLELIPGSFSNVKEWGQSDLAFKAKFKDGSEFFVGILLEHKSYRKNDVLSQIYEYTFEIMVNKNATDFRWLQTKAIIIYNGQSDWDPLAEFRKKHKDCADGQDLPFECVLVNLADIPDKLCFSESNVEAAVGVLVMKHAFDEDGLKGIVDKLVKMLSKMENGARATLVDKIVLYLGEYIDEDVVEELRMQMSIGQVLGIPTAGDRRRAAERAALRRGTKRGAEQERKKNELANAARDKKIAKFLRANGVSRKLLTAALAIK
ncbi:MAG: Rpn family recombination-promoting nuclease/putative transposase [Fibrobacter sp.]|nr:Rpn family recombination-promoting nuclease/putative transposase [Fibrobacter sp.]